MLPGLGKERFRRALQGKAAAALDLELIGYRRDDCQLEFWNLCQVEPSQNFIVKRCERSIKMVHKVIFPLDLQLAWFSSCWNPSLTFMSGGHRTAWEEVPMWGKTSNKQQVREPFCIASPWNLSEVKPS
jgi:hypothetical protein